MKKLAAIVLLVFVLFFSATDTFAQTLLLSYDGNVYKYSGRVYSLKVNGELVNTDIPPVIINNRTMVPTRAAFEKLGGTVSWNAKAQKMSIVLDGTNIEFIANNSNVKVNGKSFKMDMPAKLVNGRLMIPLTFFSKQLDMKIGWFPDDNLVTIDIKPVPGKAGQSQMDTPARTLVLSYDGKTYKYNNKLFNLKINGELVNTDMPSIIMDNRTMVPTRAAFEKLGGTVSWNATAQKMSVILEGKNIEFKNNDYNVKIDGKSSKMDMPAKLVNGRLMIPLTFFSKQLDMKIGWFPDDNLVTIDIRSALDKVEYSRQGSREQVVLLLNRYDKYYITRATGPDRIIVDFPNTAAPEKETKINTGGSLVKSIRYAQFDNGIARVVLDTGGQPQYQVDEKKGRLMLYVDNPTYKNITYKNDGDRVCFLLKGVELTDGSEKPDIYYTEKYDTTNNKYTLTFNSSLGDVGSGVIKINDSLITSLEVAVNTNTKKTSVTFNAKDKFFYEVVGRPEVGDTAIIILKPASKADKLVVIDPGHGGKEPGAIYSGVYEKNINLDIALKLNALLKSKNIKTYMTREDDSYIGLYERAFIANDLKAQLFLSIHNNAIDDPDYGGTMTLYRPTGYEGWKLNGKQFAQIIQNSLLATLKTKDRRIIERPGLVVLKDTKMPASLAEVAFMTNKSDMTNLKNDTFRQKAASALCDAVIQALKQLQ